MDEHAEELAVGKTAPADKSRQNEALRKKAISDHKKNEEILSSCSYCPSSPAFAKHLMVATGSKTYLALPEKGTLTKGHCIIAPIDHLHATSSVDEEVWQEIRNFKKCLMRMFHEENRGVVFLEMTSEPKKQRHTYVECIPLPADLAQDTPIYFKKALSESDELWSQHAKIIETKGKGLQRSVAKGFSYFYVEFGLDDGYVHVVEDSSKFPWYFGKEVIGGMLELEPSAWLKPKKQGFEADKKRVLDFAKQWTPFDWTTQL